ncbi:type 1 fimbrial protein [Salmonella enterica subsp. enterica serovar Sandiego]|nr:type 1 fimbrial protein [Salmonella enterica subsp. enterica serovar Sandiego]EEF9947864.1 type 1 fimbrial protein [Salmonella enterica]
MKHFKYTLIFAALVSSASAMAVEPSGNPSGTVSINGTIRNSTCSIGAPSTTTVNFDISKADINNAKAYDVITRENTPVTISVSNCQNTALGMTVSATAYDPYGAPMVYFKKQRTLTAYFFITLAWKSQRMFVVAMKPVLLAIISFNLMVIMLQLIRLLSKMKPVQETLI